MRMLRAQRNSLQKAGRYFRLAAVTAKRSGSWCRPPSAFMALVPDAIESDQHTCEPPGHSPLAIGGLVEIIVAAGLAVAALPACAARPRRTAQHAATSRPDAARQLGSASILATSVRWHAVALVAGCTSTASGRCAAGMRARDGDSRCGRLARAGGDGRMMFLRAAFVIAECRLSLRRRRSRWSPGPCWPGSCHSTRSSRPSCCCQRGKSFLPGCRCRCLLTLHSGHAERGSGGALDGGGSLRPNLLWRWQGALQGAVHAARAERGCSVEHRGPKCLCILAWGTAASSPGKKPFGVTKRQRLSCRREGAQWSSHLSHGIGSLQKQPLPPL